ncbi:MAG: hypothetical protein ABR920_13830 [Terriglobales bacterium]
MKKSGVRQWGTAVHEAGHAIVNSYLRLPMRQVTIVPSIQENTAGFAEWDGDIRYKQATSSDELCCMNAVTSLLAARAAVDLICQSYGAECHYGADERMVVDAYGNPNFSDTDSRKYMEWRADCLTRARRIVREPRVKRAIIALAKALLREKTIGGANASRFLARGRMSAHERRFRRRIVRREERALRKRMMRSDLGLAHHGETGVRKQNSKSKSKSEAENLSKSKSKSKST